MSLTESGRMTSDAMSGKPANTSALRLALEGAGCRCTQQRVAVFGHLVATKDHPTADEVFQAVKQSVPCISLATVYKSLETLVEAGLATRLHGDGGWLPARYEHRGDGHHHLRCVKTGRVSDVPMNFDPELIAKLDPELKARLKDLGFTLTGYRLELIGFYDDEQGDAS